MRILLPLLKISLATAALFAAGMVRVPSLYEWRPWLLIGVLAAAVVLIAISLRWRGWTRRKWTERADLAPFALALSALILALAMEGRFQLARWTVLRAEPSAIERLGRHIVVGYSDPAFVRDLVERGAISGIFLTQRNAAKRDAASIAREIGELQAIRVRQGLPPLWVSTDQEGGDVSRLSPPLERQPPLARIVQESKDRESKNSDGLRTAVTAYATQQGRGLAAMGINVNFAPVVDLNFGIRNPSDAFTHISDRAISADANVVSDVAGWYCDGLAAQGVRCTLKHFPGLGRVFDDTHRNEASLNAPLEELERADWIPFHRLLGRSGSLVMIGHVRLQALDATQPASTSQQVISGLLRGKWGYDGLVITDDMCMGAIYSGPGGIGEGSLRALNAGVDLLLLSWDGEQIYPVLAALLQAQDRLDAALLQRSADRLHAMRVRLPAR